MPGPNNETPGPAAPGGASGAHTEHEDHPWTRLIPDHPPRTDTPAYIASRRLMNSLVRRIKGFFYDGPGTVDKAGRKSYEDHHGGGLWLKDDEGWFLVRNLAGMEWSAQFCADPAKVEVLRQTARRLYARFPEAAAELQIQPLLDKAIKTANDVADWTDSICNASIPVSLGEHRGVLPAAGGLHHYPAPITEIEFFKYDDFQLFVTDDTGATAAVTPAGKRGSGDGRTQVVAAEPGSSFEQTAKKAWRKKRRALLPADHRASEQAFGEQYAKIATDQVDPNDPLAKAKLPSA